MQANSIQAWLETHLFRLKSDGLEPIVLNQRRIFILPTRSGLLFAITLLVMLIAAINYNLSLGHALVFLLAGLGLTGMIHTFRNLHGLHIYPCKVAPVFAGETAYFELHIENTAPQPRPRLLFSSVPGQLVSTDLAGGEQGRIEIPVTTEQRGWLVLPRVRLSSIYPLGLFVAWAYLSPSMRCLVYPSPIASPLPDGTASRDSGWLNSRAGQEDFHGFRERQPADPPGQIAWKASARNNAERPLLLKQFAGGAEVELCLDWEMTLEGASTEYRLSQMTAWILAADALQHSYCLRLPGKEIPAANGPAQRERCLKILALYPA